MILLAIDTSTQMAGVALLRDQQLLAETIWPSGLNHSVQLLPRLDNVLLQLNMKINCVDAIAVALGPGSFNGLRVGLSTAKGLAFSLGIPIVGVGTLEIEAYQQAAAGFPVYAISNAGRGEIGAACFQRLGNIWHELKTPYITTLEALCSEIKQTTIITGEYAGCSAGLIKEKLGELAVIPPDIALYRRTGFLAELGLQHLQGGYSDNVATLQPVYLRRPPITEARPKKFQQGAIRGRNT